MLVGLGREALVIGQAPRGQPGEAEGKRHHLSAHVLGGAVLVEHERAGLNGDVGRLQVHPDGAALGGQHHLAVLLA